MLEVLKKNKKVKYILRRGYIVILAETKLGAGGLIRAYGKSSQPGLLEENWYCFKQSTSFNIFCDS